MPPHALEENRIQDEGNNFVDDEEIFRVESDIVDIAEKVGSEQSVGAVNDKPDHKKRGRPIPVKSSQPVTTAKKVAEGSAPTVVRMEEVVGDGEGVSDADDIDVEFPRLSEIKKAASMQFGVVPKKRGRPAKDKDDKPKAPLTKKPRGRPPTKINRSTENNSAHLVRTDQDEPSKPAANDLRSTSSRAKTIKPPRKGYNALITNEDLDTRRPSRAAAESAKSNITIQSTKKQLYRTQDESINSSIPDLARDKKGAATAAVKRRGRPPKTQSEQSIFAVEKLVGFKVEKGVKLYHVKWVNYGASENTWEPLENLEGCKDLVATFDKKNSNSKLKSKKK